MKIQFFAFLREIAGTQQITWNKEVSTVGKLVDDLCCLYGKEFKKWLFEKDGKFSPIAIILVNGKDIRDGKGLDTPLDQNDTVLVFPPVAGG